jgi:hypothetical protein
MAVDPAGHAFSQIEAKQVAARQLVEHAPDCPVRVLRDIGRGGPPICCSGASP